MKEASLPKSDGQVSETARPLSVETPDPGVAARGGEAGRHRSAPPTGGPAVVSRFGMADSTSRRSPLKLSPTRTNEVGLIRKGLSSRRSSLSASRP